MVIFPTLFRPRVTSPREGEIITMDTAAKHAAKQQTTTTTTTNGKRQSASYRRHQQDISKDGMKTRNQAVVTFVEHRVSLR